MPRPNPFQTAVHCRRYARRRALADGDTFHVVMTGEPRALRIVLSERELFASLDIDPGNLEASVDPFLIGLARQGRE